jgi:hypothetical protein
MVFGNTSVTKWGFGINTTAANILEFNNTVTTARLTTGGVWTNASDYNVKTNFIPLNKQDILEKIAQLDISRWSYKKEAKNVSHIGPIAQQFYQLFGTGDSDKTISTIDPSGVALIGVQQLKTENENLKKRIEELEKKVALLIK